MRWHANLNFCMQKGGHARGSTYGCFMGWKEISCSVMSASSLAPVLMSCAEKGTWNEAPACQTGKGSTGAATGFTHVMVHAPRRRASKRALAVRSRRGGGTKVVHSIPIHAAAVRPRRRFGMQPAKLVHSAGRGKMRPASRLDGI